MSYDTPVFSQYITSEVLSPLISAMKAVANSKWIWASQPPHIPSTISSSAVTFTHVPTRVVGLDEI